MAPAGARVLVAVSGGADSVCLLHVLLDLEYQLEVAHFDHQTRNGESARDAQFVRELAENLGLPFHIESRPVEKEARGSGQSFEEYARTARYEFLTRTASSRDCRTVATGHHADDNAETILMRLIRGTTPAGVAGIPPVGEWDGVTVIRPLLAVTRDGIREYLKERRLPFREDVSNVDARYVRNRIRHELLPLLTENYNPRVRDALLRFAEAQRADSEWLDWQAGLVYDQLSEDGKIDRVEFRRQHDLFRRRVVAILGRRLGVRDLPFDRILAACQFIAEGATGAVFNLGSGVQLQNGRAHTKPLKPNAASLPKTPLLVPGTATALGKILRARILDKRPADNLSAYCTPHRQVFDADAAGPALSVRTRRPGDWFTPLGMTGRKKLQDYFVDAGIPVYERDAQLIVTGSDKILWIVGGAIGAHAAVTNTTKRFLEIDVIDGTEETAALDGSSDSEES